MRTQNLIKKYSILLLIYVVVYYLIYPYGLKIYYSIALEPNFKGETILTIQSIIYTITLLFNLIFAIFVLIDSKQRKLIDWVIVLITLFSVETGIILFLIWQIHKEMNNKNAAQQCITKIV